MTASADSSGHSSLPNESVDFTTAENNFKQELRTNGLTQQTSQLDMLPSDVKMKILVDYTNSGYKVALSELFDAISTYLNNSTDDSIANAETSILNFCAFGFNDVRGMLVNSDTIFNIPGGMVSVIVNVLKPFAYAFIIICVCINLSKKTLQYDLFTARGAVTIFGEVFLAKTFIDLSDTILVDIMQINNGIVNTVLTGLGFNSTINFSTMAYVIHDVNSGVPVIGSLISIILTFIGSIILILVSELMVVCIFIMMIKLGIRAVELVILRCVAPLFLSTMASDETKDIAKNFIRTFISTVVQTLFMSLAYIIMASVINEAFKAAGTGQDTNFLLMSGIYVLTLTIFIMKTPRMLNQILVR